MSHRRVHSSDPLHQIEYLDKEWDVASQLARDGSDWLLMGLDRQRFRDRIERTAEILDKILEPNLRQRIFRERFESLDTTGGTAPNQLSLAVEFETKNKIISNDKNVLDDKKTYQVDLESSKGQTDNWEPDSEPHNINSAYISRKRGRQRKNKRGRSRGNKGKRKH